MTVKQKALRFTDALLRPRVTLAVGSDLAKAEALHEKAHHGCFIANSVNFPVRHEALTTIAAH
jgi:organic hydroperoxide reductase OsmC/OhrA